MAVGPVAGTHGAAEPAGFWRPGSWAGLKTEDEVGKYIQWSQETSQGPI